MNGLLGRLQLCPDGSAQFLARCLLILGIQIGELDARNVHLVQSSLHLHTTNHLS